MKICKPFLWALVMFSAVSQAYALTVKTVELKKTSKRYTYHVNYPLFSGEKKLNQALQAQIKSRILSFKKLFAKPEDKKLKLPGINQLEVHYRLRLMNSKFISLRFQEMTTFKGAAHPNTVYWSYNYDLKHQKELELKDLFNQGAFLKVIANHCYQRLNKKNLGGDNAWLKRGTAPVSSNYKIWNLTNRGLEISFNPYQVAPYVYGRQLCFVPFKTLKPLLKGNYLLKNR